MKIKFEDDEGYCLTPCPFKRINLYTGEPTMVGSNGCNDCPSCVNIDEIENIVECEGV